MRKAPAQILNGCSPCHHDPYTAFEFIGFCIRYQTPVEENDLCDGFESVMRGKKRMWAEQRELRASGE